MHANSASGIALTIGGQKAWPHCKRCEKANPEHAFGQLSCWLLPTMSSAHRAESILRAWKSKMPATPMHGTQRGHGFLQWVGLWHLDLVAATLPYGPDSLTVAFQIHFQNPS